MLRQLSHYRPSAPHTYVNRVCTLTDFLLYCREERLLFEGGSGLLDRQLRHIMRLHLPLLRPSLSGAGGGSGGGGRTLLGERGSGGSGGGGGGEDAGLHGAMLPSYLVPSIRRPSLSDSSAEWEHTIMLIAVCGAGLMEYLLDSYPADLPDWQR